MLKQQGGQLLNTGLKDIEGKALKQFGLGGKPQGTPNDPIWIRNAGGGGIGSNGGIINGTDVNTGGTHSGGFLNNLRNLGGFGSDTNGITGQGPLGGNDFSFAGGVIPAGQFSTVGSSPELAYSGRSNTNVMPHTSIGGSSLTQNIDARGTDPVLMTARIRAATRASYVASVKASQISAQNAQTRVAH
jgi:hypothetical protein